MKTKIEELKNKWKEIIETCIYNKAPAFSFNLFKGLMEKEYEQGVEDEKKRVFNIIKYLEIEFVKPFEVGTRLLTKHLDTQIIKTKKGVEYHTKNTIQYKIFEKIKKELGGCDDKEN